MPAWRCGQWPGAPRHYRAPRSCRPLMEKPINSSRRFGADTIDLHQICDRGALDRLERAKVMQQRALARRPDAGDFLQAGLAQVAHAARAVRADRETVRLIAQPLDEIKHRIARRQLERVPVRKKESLAAGVAIRPLGDGDQRHRDAERREHLARRAELPLPAVDKYEVRPGRLGLLVIRWLAALRHTFPLLLRKR